MNKNWKMICQVPDAHFMWALALLDTSTDFGRQVVERFPEYFTEEGQAGPIPLSVLRREAGQVAAGNGYTGQPDDDAALVSDDVCRRFNIPVQGFNGPRSHDKARESLPAELARLTEVEGIGHVAEWGGKKVVVVENGMPDYIYLAPAECVAVDR